MEYVTSIILMQIFFVQLKGNSRISSLKEEIKFLADMRISVESFICGDHSHQIIKMPQYHYE
jgi:hypothetical protein